MVVVDGDASGTAVRSLRFGVSDRFRRSSAMVDRYTEWAGWADESADGRPRQGTGTDSAEGSLHVAKVRVAGSNPVVRSL